MEHNEILHVNLRSSISQEPDIGGVDTMYQLGVLHNDYLSDSISYALCSSSSTLDMLTFIVCRWQPLDFLEPELITNNQYV